MSSITEFIARAPHLRASALGAAADTVAACLRSLLRWPSDTVTIGHLESLSDHQLRDIGITRSEIALVVRGTDIDRVRGRHAID
jgi:uncharacterized protein YjiS (DUF1127 family)